MSKFSVKKPFTIFVAVIIVLVMGIVSFMNMTPDLLPNLDMPYILVVTAWPGATPEKVETTITKPMEQSMATLEHIKNINSTSGANSSMLMLEFENSVNMDTIAVDILQRTTQLQGYWEDGVQTPYILKLNPSMIPVSVAAVKMEGMDTIDLSTFVDETLLNKLEGIPGVASINATGMIEEKVNIRLSAEKIEAANRKVVAALDRQFAETEEELTDAQVEIEGNIDDLEGKLQQLKDGAAELANKTAEGEATISQKQAELIEGKIQIMEQMTALEAQLEGLKDSEKQLKELQKQVEELEATQAQLTESIQALGTLKEAVEQLNAAELALNAEIERQTQLIKDQGLPPEMEEQAIAAMLAAIQESEEYVQLQAGIAEMEIQLAAMGIESRDPDAVQALMDQAQEGLDQVNAGLDQIDTMLAQQGLKRSKIAAALKEMEKGRKKMQDGLAQLTTLLQELDSGEVALADAMTELSRTKTNTLFELSDASSQLAVGSAALSNALTEVEGGLEQLTDARKAAYDNADLHNIITMDRLAQILTAQNFSMPVGYVAQDGVDYLVSVGEDFASVEELSDLMLVDLDLDGLAPIYLRDVAEVLVTDNADSVYARIDGNDGVLLTFSKQSTYSTAAVSDNIAAQFEALSQQYPGLEFVNLIDQGDYIYMVVQAILENLLLGAVFAVIILFLFLRDIRPTFITLCSIPISVLFALCLMYFTGVTINIISLSGLAVAVGMLVDNSVVVIENVYRLRAKGLSATRAAISGAAQVAGAIAASTLTTICVFLPIVFVEGITRQLFTDLALTLGYSLIASLIVALTLVPAMSSGLLRNAKPKEGRIFAKFLGGYKRALGWTLRHKAPVLVFSVLMLGLSAWLVLARGFTFMPAMDATQITVNMEMPEGSTLDDTRKMSDTVIERIRGIDGVETVGAMVGGGNILGFGTGAADVATVTMYVQVQEDGPQGGNAVGAEITRLTADLDAVIEPSSSTGDLSVLGGSGITINLYGDDMQDLFAAAQETAAVLERVEGTADIDDGIGETDPEIRFVVDKEKAMKQGLTVAQVYMELQKALTLERSSTTISWEGDNYDVIIMNGEEAQLTPGYIKAYRFTVTGTDGEEKELAIGDIATIQDTVTATSISRENQRRTLPVSAGIADGYNVSLVTAQAERAMRDAQLPAGVSYEFSGENETIMDSFRDLAQMLLLGVLFVYLIMVAQFQSLKSPFIVMFTIPLAFTGGFLGLLITGMELSVVSLIGMVMLVGIIVNNGIVLVDYINQLRMGGTEKNAAILEAGVTRMRPILMTSITTILGLIVMALGRGAGAELMQPVAIVCIGGLTYATLLTLFVVPVMYDMMNRKQFRTIAEEDLVISDE